MTAPGNTPPLPAYEQWKLDGKCVRGCGRPAADDSLLCTKCRPKQLKRQRQSMAAIRKARRAAGRCAYCPAKSKTYRCHACATKLRADRSSVTSSVNQFDDRLERIRQRTVVGDDGRTRYHGQTRRGRQTVADLDEQDLSLALTYLTKARDGLRFARRPEAADVPRIQRREAVMAALGYAELGRRFVVESLERNGYETPDAIDDSEEDDE